MRQYIIDAFADEVFTGNPAAVCVLNEWISDDLMQKIAIENNLSETAFTVKSGGKYELRWFTPGGEIDLCGHATLATSYVIMNRYEKDRKSVSFETKSGTLTVQRLDDLYEMKFPAYSLKQIPVTQDMTEAMGAQPEAAYLGRDLLCVFDSPETIAQMKPDLDKIKELNGLLLHVTAKGIETDCISRTFAPKLAVDEDPVCGSGHCHIVPYWANTLAKSELTAYQASKRGGTLFCRLEGESVYLTGRAVLYAEAEIHV